MRTLLSFLVAIRVMGQVASASVAAQDADAGPSAAAERAFVRVDGRKRAVAPGDVIARGRRVAVQGARAAEGGKATCDIPKTEYGLEGSSARSVEITLKVTEDCQLVVGSVDVNVPPHKIRGEDPRSKQEQGRAERASGPQAAAVARRQTGGWHEHYDCCRLLLTESYAHMKYYDNGSRVYGPHDELRYCYNARDGWRGTGSLEDQSDTRRFQWIWKRCSFEWINNSYQHTLDVDVYSYPANDWAVYCTRYGKTVPKAEFKCGKRHWTL